MPQDIKNQEPIRRSTWKEFVFQIFISVEGPNIFVIPALFKQIGILVGIVASVVVGLFYTNAMHSYLKCANEMSRRRNVPQQSLYKLPQMVFEEISCPRIGHYIKLYLKYEIIISWCLGLSLQWQFIVENLKLILSYYQYTPDNVHILACLLLPLILISWIPSLKYIDYVSYIVTFSIFLVTGVIVYLLVWHTPEYATFEVIVPVNLASLVTFTSYMFIMLSFTPLVFPLKNTMKNPESLSKTFGPLTLVIAAMIVLNCAITVLVYVEIGDDVEENLFENFSHTPLVLATNCFFALLAMASISPSLLVIIMAFWNDGLENHLCDSKYTKLYEYLVRSSICVFITLGVILVPSFTNLINLITCFSFPFDSIMLPAVLEIVLAWSDSKKRCTREFKLICVKNTIIGVFSLAVIVLSLIVCVGNFT
ncbi:proton-coupled amino acid transporter-like protein pathetic [Planococcus citri]|uniref:proton-coupled amino acid transporter-like protein pathetic n=1 Tax=Planococcus citri TaxID=170843 RepID=UPI0031F93ABE